MKKSLTKRIFSIALCLAMVLGVMPMMTFAGTENVTKAEYTNVDSYEKLAEAFLDTSDEVYVTLSGDISFSGKETIIGNAGQTYYVNGSDFTLENADFGGEGTIRISVNIMSKQGNTPALTLNDDVVVDVTGEILAENEGNDGVHLYDNASFNMNGDITSLNGVAIYSNGKSQFNVNGNINGGSSNDNADDAVIIEGEANGYIKGDVTASGGDGIWAAEKSNISVDGNIKAACNDAVDANDYAVIYVYGNTYGGEGGEGVEANDDSSVTVYGNSYGGDGKAPDENGNLDEGTYDSPYGYSDGGFGVYATGNAYVYVTGSVYGGDSYGTASYAGDGVYALDFSEVVIGNNRYGNTSVALGGNQIADPDVEADLSGGYAGSGVVADSTATVTVIGTAQGGDSVAQGAVGSSGIIVILEEKQEGVEPGKIAVSDKVIAGNITGKNAYESPAIFYGSMYEDDGKTPEDYIIPVIITGEMVLPEGSTYELLDDNVGGVVDYVKENNLLFSSEGCLPNLVLWSTDDTNDEYIYGIEDLYTDINNEEEGFFWDAETQTLTINSNFKRGIYGGGDLTVLVDGNVSISSATTVNYGIISALNTLTIKSADSDGKGTLSIMSTARSNSPALRSGAPLSGIDESGDIVIDNVNVIIEESNSLLSESDNENIKDVISSPINTTGGDLYLNGNLSVSVYGYNNLACINAENVYVNENGKLDLQNKIKDNAEKELINNRTIYGIYGNLIVSDNAEVTVEMNNECTDTDVTLKALVAKKIEATDNASVIGTVLCEKGEGYAADEVSVKDSAVVIINGIQIGGKQENEPETKPVPTPDIPKTDNDGNILLYSVAMCISSIAILGIMVFDRKKKAAVKK